MIVLRKDLVQYILSKEKYKRARCYDTVDSFMCFLKLSLLIEMNLHNRVSGGMSYLQFFRLF